MPIFSCFFFSSFPQCNKSNCTICSSMHCIGPQLYGLSCILLALGRCPSWLLRSPLQFMDHVSFNSHRPLSIHALWLDHNAVLSTTATVGPRGFLVLFGRPGSLNPPNRNNCARQSLCALLMLVTELFLSFWRPRAWLAIHAKYAKLCNLSPD